MQPEQKVSWSPLRCIRIQQLLRINTPTIYQGIIACHNRSTQHQKSGRFPYQWEEFAGMPKTWPCWREGIVEMPRIKKLAINSLCYFASGAYTKPKNWVKLYAPNLNPKPWSLPSTRLRAIRFIGTPKSIPRTLGNPNPYWV